jgi:aconitate hydratase
MGVLPLGFEPGQGRDTLGLTGRETFSIAGIAGLTPGANVRVRAVREDGTEINFEAIVRLNSPMEVAYLRHGGILPRVLRMFLGEQERRG